MPRAGASAPCVLIAAALLCTALVAGCSSPKNSASATTTVPTGATTSTTFPHPKQVTTTTIVGCTVPHYALSVLGSDATAGSFLVTLGLRNTSQSTCTLSGFPAIELFNRRGAPIASTTVQAGSLPSTDFTPAPVSLGSEATAYFNLVYADTSGDGSPCPTAWAIGATPPASSIRLRVSGRFKVCNATVTVSPVFAAGSPETQTTAPGLRQLTF